MPSAIPIVAGDLPGRKGLRQDKVKTARKGVMFDLCAEWLQVSLIAEKRT